LLSNNGLALNNLENNFCDVSELFVKNTTTGSARDFVNLIGINTIGLKFYAERGAGSSSVFVTRKIKEWNDTI
jgi:hypothetical protein